MSLQDRLKLLLKERNTSAWELSVASNVPYTTIKSIIEGKSLNMRVDTASTIARELGVSVDFLLGNTTFENPKLYIEEELQKLELSNETYDKVLDCFLENDYLDIANLTFSDSDDIPTQKFKQAFNLIFKVYLNYHSCKPLDIDLMDREIDDETMIKKIEEHYSPVDIDFRYLLKELDRKKILSPLYFDDIVTIPVVGKVSAGLPLLADENIEGYEFAPSSRLNKDYDYFYLIVNGDSMNRMFSHGSRVLVQKQSDLENGDIGVIRVNGDDATVKRFKREGNIIILEPLSTNPEHQLQIYNPEEIEIEIIGKVISYTCNI